MLDDDDENDDEVEVPRLLSFCVPHNNYNNDDDDKSPIESRNDRRKYLSLDSICKLLYCVVLVAFVCWSAPKIACLLVLKLTTHSNNKEPASQPASPDDDNDKQQSRECANVLTGGVIERGARWRVPRSMVYVRVGGRGRASERCIIYNESLCALGRKLQILA